MSPDEIYKSLRLAIVLLGLASTVDGATTQSSLDEIWKNPCSKVPMRHGRSTVEETQLNTFVKKFDTEFRRQLEKLYPNSSSNRLPKRGCLKVNQMVRLIGNQRNNLTMAHEQFYKYMFTVMTYIHQLQNTPVRTKQIFDSSLRRDIFEAMKLNLKLVMCEYSEVLPKEVLLTKTPTVRTGCLPKTLDKSKAQIADFQLALQMKKFFAKTRKKLRQMKRNRKVRQNRRKKHV